MHRYRPSTPSEIDVIENAMLDLLVLGDEAETARLTEPAPAAVALVLRARSEVSAAANIYREAAQLLRVRSLMLGADPARYRSQGWLALGL